MAFPKTNEVNDYFKEKINWWQHYILENTNFQQLNLPKKHWIVFMLYWMIFDAYMTELSQLNQAGQRLEYFLRNDSDFKTHIINKNISAKTLKDLSPIPDMRPNSSRQVHLNDENNLDEIFNFLYQIRCNLFHGAKSIKNPKSDKLVSESAKYLESSVGSWIKGE